MNIPEIQWKRDPKYGKFNCEKICQQVYPQRKIYIDSKWKDHMCNEVGCRNRFIVIDGNEKLYRYCCATPQNKIKGGRGEINSVHRCVNNPVRGNKSKPNSKLCQFHESGKKDIMHQEERLDLRPVTRSVTSQLLFEVTSQKGCKDESNVNKYMERTAGMLYAIRPCGIRVSHCEMFTAESLSTVFSCLIDIFSDNPSENDIKGIVYDRSCDLHPYLVRLGNEDNNTAEKYSRLHYVVDIFHAEKHTLPKCVITSDQCEYHPNLEKFQHIRSMNMEICESTFHLINPLKHVLRNMTYGKRLVILKLLDDNYNNRLLKHL